MPHFNLGRILEITGKSIEAAKMYQKALELNKITEEIDSQEIINKLYGLFEV